MCLLGRSALRAPGARAHQQILTFGRKQQLRPQVVDLNRVVSDTVAMLRLPSVHGIVEQIGGLIDVASRLGVGTTIHIALPAVDSRPVEQLRERDPSLRVLFTSGHTSDLLAES